MWSAKAVMQELMEIMEGRKQGSSGKGDIKNDYFIYGTCYVSSSQR